MTTIYVLTMILFQTGYGGSSSIQTHEYNNSGTCEDAKLAFLTAFEDKRGEAIAFCKAK